MNDPLMPSVAALAARIPDGAKLAVPADYSGVAMAATRALVARGARDLHLVCVPVSGLQADILIGAGCVSTIETAGITLGEYGTGPRFAQAVKAGSLRLLDATCPALHAGLQAAEKGIPFMVLRGILGSDILARRPDWLVIGNPFAAEPADDPIVALPAIHPDVALFHAPLADRAGNVWIGRRRELMTMAHAATLTLVTVEQVVDKDLLADDATAAGTIPALYVSGVAEAPAGAWPLNLWDRYEADGVTLAAYVQAARSDAGFADFLARWLDGRLKGGAVAQAAE